MIEAPSLWGVAANLLDPPVSYARDPVAWTQDVLREHVWSKQGEILESVRDNRHTAVHSCHESGKSFIAARAVAWWLDQHPPGTAFAVTTAPTGAQVRAILWREINRAHSKGKLLGRCNQTEWWLGNEMVAFGRKPSEHNSEAFQGIHQQFVLVVIDEANGVPKSLWDAAETLIANETGRMLAIGNPDDPASYFAEMCKPGSGFRVIHIDAFDTPNFTGEYVPPEVAQQLISPTWQQERMEKWGEDSPLYISKVRGKFPPYATDSAIPWSWLEECRKPEGKHLYAPKREDEAVMGLDVGAGGDETVMWIRRGLRAVTKITDHSADPEVVAAKVMRAIREHKVHRIKIDIIGIGWGVAGLLRKLIRDARAEESLGWDVEVLDVNVAEASSDREHYANLRAELWWEVGRENSRSRHWDLSKVDDDTIAQLIAPKYSIAPNGLVRVEKKEDVKARIGRSTDDADALLMAFYEPPREVWRAV